MPSKYRSLNPKIKFRFNPASNELVLRIKLDPKDDETEKGNYGITGLDMPPLGDFYPALRGVRLLLSCWLDGRVTSPSRLVKRVKKSQVKKL